MSECTGVPGPAGDRTHPLPSPTASYIARVLRTGACGGRSGSGIAARGRATRVARRPGEHAGRTSAKLPPTPCSSNSRMHRAIRPTRGPRARVNRGDQDTSSVYPRRTPHINLDASTVWVVFPDGSIASRDERRCTRPGDHRHAPGSTRRRRWPGKRSIPQGHVIADPSVVGPGCCSHCGRPSPASPPAPRATMSSPVRLPASGDHPVLVPEVDDRGGRCRLARSANKSGATRRRPRTSPRAHASANVIADPIEIPRRTVYDGWIRAAAPPPPAAGTAVPAGEVPATVVGRPGDHQETAPRDFAQTGQQ